VGDLATTATLMEGGCWTFRIRTFAFFFWTGEVFVRFVADFEDSLS